MSLDPRSIATLGIGYGARAVACLGLWTSEAPPQPPPAVVTQAPRAGRSRIMRRPRRYVERELQTPEGPLIVLVPDDWTADDLLTLATSLVLTDALS